MSHKRDECFLHNHAEVRFYFIVTHFIEEEYSNWTNVKFTMANISTFECLPNELIVCIFGYLETADNFQAFFHCNVRLRKLVKQYVTYSRRALDKDITRFSTLHSWYKHLNFVDGGVTFYMVPLRGEQERYSFNPRISDFTGVHWHFTRGRTMPLGDERIEQISRKYSVKLNPLFATHGYDVLPFRKENRDFLRNYHPSQFELLATTLFSESYMSTHNDYEHSEEIRTLSEIIAVNERQRLRSIIHQAATCIWKEIQALEDVNVIDIGYVQQTAGSVRLMTIERLKSPQKE